MKDDEYWVKSGDLETGTWRLSKDVFTNGKTAIRLTKLTSCTIVKDEHTTTQSGSGRIAGGILGAALLGPIGAIGGLLSGGRKRIDETIIHCGFDDDRSFTANSTQIGAANLVRIAHQNSGRAPILKAEQSLSSGGDTIECPQCAELIKRKAKICRFCGFTLTTIELSEPSLADPNDTAQTAEGASYSRFVADYRKQVVDSVFSNDNDIVKIVKELVAELKRNPRTYLYVPSSNIAKRFGVTSRDIEKITNKLVTMEEIVSTCIEKRDMSSPFIEIDPFIDLNSKTIEQLVEIVSEVRLDRKFNNFDEEAKAFSEEMTRRTEIVIRTPDIRDMQHSFYYLVQPRNNPAPFYVIDNALVFIDPDLRKKKSRAKAVKSKDVNRKLNSILESPEFVNWCDENISEDVNSTGVVKLYCGAREVEKLANEKGVNEDEEWTSAFVYELLAYWEEDVSKGDATPDEWLLSRYAGLIDNHNNNQEKRIEGSLVVDTFANGFKSV